MPLSPTDFYAYSRATGTPVPEDAEERARIASDVYDFRQNQLKTPEQGPNYGAIAGLSALGLGLAAGGVGLARAFRGHAPQVAAKDVIKQRQAAEPVVQAIAKAGVPVVRTTTEVVQPSRVVEQAPVATEIVDRQRMVRRHGRMVALSDSVPRIQQENLVARDRAQELIDEYLGNIDLEQKGFVPQTKTEQMQQLAELNRQRAITNRAIKSRGEEVLAEIQNEAKPFNLTYIESTGAVKPVLDVRTRLRNAGISLSGDLDELEVSAGPDTIPSRLNHPYSSHPKESIRQTAQQEEQMAQALLQKAGVTPEEAKSYWKGVLDHFIETEEDLTSIQQSEAPQLAAQQRAAVESGEDQATGRFQHMLQLNEDLDTSQIDVMEAMAEHQYRVGMEQDEPGHVPTRQLPDGLPHIQQEDPVAGAQNFLTQRRAELQKEGLSPGRIEQQLLAGRGGTALKQGLELWASTGDPATAQMISNTPATPLHIKPVVQLDSTASEIPTGSFYEGFKAREPFLDKLEGADIYYTNEISAIADKLQTVPTHIQNPHYQELSNTLGIAQHAWKQGDWSARPVVYNAKAALEKTVELIPNPEHTDLTHTLNYAHSRRNDVRSQIAAKQQEATDFPQLVKLKNIQEGVRGHYEVDPNTQEIIIDAQTNLPKIEVRTGRPSVAEGIVTEAASGTAIRGRTGQFDPEGQSKSSVGIYGIEPTNIPLGPESMEAGIRPSAVPGKSFKVTSHNPEEVRQAARLRTMGERTLSKPEVARQSLDVAKKIRELQSSGRPDAQQQLQDYIQGLKD